MTNISCKYTKIRTNQTAKSTKIRTNPENAAWLRHNSVLRKSFYAYYGKIPKCFCKIYPKIRKSVMIYIEQVWRLIDKLIAKLDVKN